MDGSSFTPQLRHALGAALHVALGRGQRELQSGDLTLGIMSLPEGDAAMAILDTLGIDTELLRDQVTRALPTRRDSPSAAVPTELPYDLRATRALQRAIVEARRMNHDRTSTAHLLIAIVQDPEPSIARVLADAGVTLEGVESETQSQASRGTAALGELITSPTRRA